MLTYTCLDNVDTLKRLDTNINERLQQNVALNDVYAVVDNVQGTKNEMIFKLIVYLDDTKQTALDIKHYTFAPSVAEDASNFIKQAYEYLKTLDEFSGAIDC